jgi:pimeloyl-ACP methyl ester carboxylesterase
MHAGALITVVYPLVHVRGRAASRVRTWTHEQTLARECYRVVAASDGADPSQEREVEALLGPHDTLIRMPGAPDAGLWNAGAARAGTPWLVFTEGHCWATPGCLEAVARWIATGPAEGAGNFLVGHDADHVVARLSRRWFGLVQARWRAPDEWPRVHRAGFAIRADAFEAVGGFEPEYGQLTGEADALVKPERQAYRLHQDVPGSRLLVLVGTGHQIPQTRPEEVAEAVRLAATAAAVLSDPP